MADTFVRLFVFVILTAIAAYGLTLLPEALDHGEDPSALLIILGLVGMAGLAGTTIARHFRARSDHEQELDP